MLHEEVEGTIPAAEARLSTEKVSSLLKDYFVFNNGGCRAPKGCMGAYTALGTTLLIFNEHLTTKKYSLGGSLQDPH